MSTDLWHLIIKILILAYFQNIAFTITSRSRNRDDMRYHMIASVFSNGIWFLTFRELIRGDMNYILFIPYLIGTVAGSLTGIKVSMFFEKILGASADAHLTLNKTKKND